MKSPTANPKDIVVIKHADDSHRTDRGRVIDTGPKGKKDRYVPELQT